MKNNRVTALCIVVIVIMLSSSSLLYTMIGTDEHERPVAQISCERDIQRVNMNFSFDGSMSTGDILQYRWELGDGNYSGRANPVHSYNRSGWYTVRLRVTDSIGLSATDTILVGVQNHDLHEELTGNRIIHPAPRGQPYDLIYFDIYDGTTRPTITGRWSGSAVCLELDIFIMTLPSDVGPRLVSEDLGRFSGNFDVTREVELPEDGAVDCPYIMVVQVIGGTITDYSLELTVEY